MIPARFPVPLPVRVRIRTGVRDTERLPLDDSALGPALLEIVEHATEQGRGLPAPAALVLFPDQVQQADLRPLATSKGDVHRFVASMTAQDDVLAVGIAGTLKLKWRRDLEPMPTLAVFLEWPDGRWWSAMRPVPKRTLDPSMRARIRMAEEGWPKPRGLGGWWSRARFERLQIKLTRAQPVH